MDRGNTKGTIHMIDPSKALAWLNEIENCSHLNKGDRQLIGAIGQARLSDLGRAQILERLRNDAHSSADPLRTAEILLYCAAIGHWRGWCPQAARDAREAVIAYDADDHRRAVALWILGIVQWEMLQNHEAYRNWAEARKIFKHCQISSQHSPNAIDWYEDPIWQMEVELVVRPEEISTWLNHFERSSLRPPTGQVLQSMREKIRQRAYPSIYVLMQDLQEANRRSERIHERAEIYLEFGLATYQIGNSHFAIELLRKAVSDFYPGIGTYHKQAVAHCMLGAVEWMHTSSRKQAAADWLRCIDEFEQLRDCADRDNFPKKEKWYSEHRDILSSALLERVKPAKQSDPANDNPEKNDSESPVSVASKNKTYAYDDLLSRVLWDRATADRLIEFERKRAPTADRNELIRRAIERWIRDNQ